jgi:gamma-glutamyltranspeptidase / glutathione hydrolase
VSLGIGLALGAGACGVGAASGGRTARPSISAPPAPPAPLASDAGAANLLPTDWPLRPRAAPVTAPDGMVATDAALATRVGADILASGGNAVDAAVAVALALAVVFPTAGNIGGGGFLVARVDGKSFALDFRETAPASATRDMFLGADGKPTRDSREGARSAGVPGSVAGLWEAWKTLGSKRKTWPELVAPAIALSDRGFTVDAPFQATILLAKPRLAKYPASVGLFLPNDGPPALGTIWRNPDLAGVLRRIAERGPAGFYEGPVAEAIARAAKDGGGIITGDDLRAYRAKWRTPMEFDYRGEHIVGMPPPSSGGLTMAMIAHILAGWNVRALGWHSAQSVHLAAEAMRRAFAARNAKLGDPDFVTNPVGELSSPAWAEQQRSTVRMDRATPTAELFGPVARDTAGTHTTHLSVVDASGNAVALTTTLNAWFGSGVTVAECGFLLNDEMDDFAAVPGTANAFGLVQGEPNAIAPGKRMLSSMSPTIVVGPSGAVDLVLGAAGGSRIITTVFEELSNAVDFGMDAESAVYAPRFHQQDSPDVLLLEPHALPDEVRRALDQMGHATKEVEHIADAPAIGRLGAQWLGVAEPRRLGSLASGPRSLVFFAR